jgi:voltage-dependent potassium channel beta subunit
VTPGEIGERRMEYRRLGKSGLKVSVLSFGSWVTFGPQVDTSLAEQQLSYAREHGVNFFDTAEVYAGGQAEVILGEAIAKLDWPRYSYVVSTKLFWGIFDDVNMRETLNRKYLMQAIDGSLERLGLEFVDLLYCHRADPKTPIEETVFAMSEIVTSGKALYWGTSEWPAADLRGAFEIAERNHLHKPVVEQPQYNIFEREKVEDEFARLYDDFGLGLTTWSPLASGLLTGKYLDGAPQGSRATLPGYEWLRPRLVDSAEREKVAKLVQIAADLGCTPAQMAIAWCARNPDVSSVITGASRISQLEENLGAVDVIARLTPDVLQAIDEAVA